MSNETVVQSNLNLLRSEKDCDVVFIVGTARERISCHQLLLKVRSPVFEIMFSERWRSDREIEEVTIPDVEPQIFKLFLEFIYGDKFTTKISEAIKIHYVANKYQVKPLIEKCDLLMQTAITMPDAVDIYQASGQYGYSRLKKQAGDLMAKYFSKFVSYMSTFQHMEESTLIDLVSRDDLLILELPLFYMLLCWARRKLNQLNSTPTLNPNPVDMRNLLKNILPLVRFPLMTLSDFVNHVVSTKILTSEECVRVISFMESCETNREELRGKVGFPYRRRNLTLDERNRLVEFYENDRDQTDSPPYNCLEFKGVKNHMDTLQFSPKWMKRLNSLSSFKKAEITSVILRGPNYSLLENTAFHSISRLPQKWKVSLKLERFTSEVGGRQHCTSFTRGHVDIFGDQDTEIVIEPPFVLNKGNQHRITVSYASEVWLPIVPETLVESDRATLKRIKKKCFLENNLGVLELSDVLICTHNSTRFYDPFYFGPQLIPCFSSHCIRSLKLNTSTSLV